MLTAPGAERRLEFQTFMLTFGSTSRALVRRLGADAVFSLTEPPLGCTERMLETYVERVWRRCIKRCVACSCKVALRRRP
jgi:hypothetical protein